MGVMASHPSGIWVKEMLDAYQNRHFILDDGSFDMRTNVQYINAIMREQGFVQNGEEQDYKDLHIFPVEYFCLRGKESEKVDGNQIGGIFLSLLNCRRPLFTKEEAPFIKEPLI